MLWTVEYVTVALKNPMVPFRKKKKGPNGSNSPAERGEGGVGVTP